MGERKQRFFWQGSSAFTGGNFVGRPSNHLDRGSREKLYDLICRGSATLLVVSHDRVLLNLLSTMLELERKGIVLYGGNYDFYKEQKEIHLNVLREQVEEKQKELRLAKKIAKDAAERQQKREVGERSKV